MRGLILPGLNGSGPAHWQTLWERQYQFKRVIQKDWQIPDAELWTESLDAAIRSHSDKVVVIAHSMGCWTLIHWAALHADSKDLVESALLVAPPDISMSELLPNSAQDFLLHPKDQLPFPSILVGSENDPYASLENTKPGFIN